MAISVKAKELGYYGGTRRRPGDVFEIADEKERGKWMIEADAPLPVPKEAMPFTSNVQGTKAGGNVYKTDKEAWEEPVGESKAETPKSKKKKTSKRRK